MGKLGKTGRLGKTIRIDPVTGEPLSDQPTGPDDLFYDELSSVPPEGVPLPDVVITEKEYDAEFGDS